jgi:hypothetical protein
MTLNHTAGNIKKWVVDYKRWLLPGEAILTQSVVSSSTTLTVTNTLINLHKEVWFYLNGGVTGETPTITVTVTTSKGETKIDVFDVLVTSP